MSTSLATDAEILKLARLLDVEPATIGYLDAVPAGDLKVLRDGVTDLLFSSGAAIMGRLGNAAKRLPSQLAATICERAFGPLLTARAAASTEPAKAVDIARRLSPDFLTEVTLRLDPRRIGAIISGVPTRLVASTAAELGRRGEYVTMGQFLPHLTDEALAAALGVLDDESLLRAAFVIEDPAAVERAFNLLGKDRLADILHCAAENDLQREAQALLGEVAATLDEAENP